MDWSSYDRVAIRSTWDYPQRLDGVPRLARRGRRGDRAGQPDRCRPLEPRQALPLGVGRRPRSRWFPRSSSSPVAPRSSPDRSLSSNRPSARAVATPVLRPGTGRRVPCPVGRLHAGVNPSWCNPCSPRSRPTANGRWCSSTVASATQPANGSSSRPAASRTLFAAETTAAHVADDEQIGAAQAAMDVVSARLASPPTPASTSSATTTTGLRPRNRVDRAVVVPAPGRTRPQPTGSRRH